MDLASFFDRAWQDYLATTPTARKIRRLLEAEGERLVNDHIALRTFDHPRVDIDRLADYFLARGYHEAAERHEFPAKKLRARHYEHPQGHPKVFISALRMEAFSDAFQDRIRNCIACVPEGVGALELFTGAVPWPRRRDVYRMLAAESEYAAWVYALGYRPNHFTISVNHLQRFGELAALNHFLSDHGFELNPAGGEIKGSPAVGLEQSSTLADRMEFVFDDGPLEIRSCYYEFAKRYPLDPQDPELLYQGFVTASADRIFESTDGQNTEPVKGD